MKYQIIPVSGDTFQIISEFRGLAVVSQNIINGSHCIVCVYDTPYEGQNFREFLRLSEIKFRIHSGDPMCITELIFMALDQMHSDVRPEPSTESNTEAVNHIIEGDQISISHDMARELKAQYIHDNEEAKDYQDVVQIPLGFNETLRKVVRAHINYIKATQADIDEREYDSLVMFDMLTWEALLSYPLSININQKKIDSFCNIHGIDFPKFIND